MTARDDRMLAAEFVLGFLEGAEQAEAERRLESDADFVREVEAWRVRFAAFDDSTAPEEPAADLWHRIETAISTQPGIS